MEIKILTHKVIGCAYKVHNTLGPGFLEKVYENALKIDFRTPAFMSGSSPKFQSFMKAGKLVFTFQICGSKSN
jgi:GxxExxY protein